MKKIVFVAAFAALAFAGCQKEASIDAPKTNDSVLTAVSDNFPDSKTVLDGVKVLWNGGDRIAVYNGSEVAESSTAADKSATLSNRYKPRSVPGCDRNSPRQRDRARRYSLRLRSKR